jgi:hypothetical protein
VKKTTCSRKKNVLKNVLPDLKSDAGCIVGWQVFFFFTLVRGPRRSLSLELSVARVYEPWIRARLGTSSAGRSAGFHPKTRGD